MTPSQDPPRLFGKKGTAGAKEAWAAPAWLKSTETTPLPLRAVLNGTAMADGAASIEDGEAKAAYREAYEEGVRKAKSAVEAIMERYHQAILDLEMLRDAILVETERDVVELALKVTREVLQVEDNVCRDFTERMVEHSLKILREADSITLRVSSTDHKALTSRHPELVSERGVVHIIEDSSITLGGVVAECSFGRVDATLERRLHDAAQALRGGSDAPAPIDETSEEPP